MHGNTKDARKWSGQAVLLVMPGWIMNSLDLLYFHIQYIIIPRTDLQKLRLLQKFPLIACHFHLLKGCTSMNRYHKHLKDFPKLSELQSPACFFSQCRWWRCDLRETWCEGHVAILQIYPQTSSLWQPPCLLKINELSPCAPKPKPYPNLNRSCTLDWQIFAQWDVLCLCLNEMKPLRMGVDPCLKQRTMRTAPTLARSYSDVSWESCPARKWFKWSNQFL